ncbi:MAG: hypothetical protein Nk1A_1180 [Endomicrobiia bacterium]|nr:MAG: hypothetical protein Nk1A_1180 [Endomicrobiia bacterium]
MKKMFLFIVLLFFLYFCVLKHGIFTGEFRSGFSKWFLKYKENWKTTIIRQIEKI